MKLRYDAVDTLIVCAIAGACIALMLWLIGLAAGCAVVRDGSDKPLDGPALDRLMLGIYTEREPE